MNLTQLKRAQREAESAARAAGALMRRNLTASKKRNEETQHDIKLELDVRCQKLIEASLHKAYPEIALLGEEGVTGDAAAAYRWVVDPIDGTVNFAYGLPHACVSIALQGPMKVRDPRRGTLPGADYVTLLGVVYDPFLDEMWTAIKGQPAMLNGKRIRVSDRSKLEEAIVAIGFSKTKASLDATLPSFNRLIYRVRKTRMLGAAALSLTWTAAGRMDAFVETGIRIWDIAAGGLILESAGGDFWHRPVQGEHRYMMIANNGKLTTKLKRYLPRKI